MPHNMRIICSIALPLVINSAVAVAQVVGVEAAPLPLKLVNRIATSVSLPGLITIPIKSDLDGNIYVRTINTRSPALTPVVRISPDGKKSLVFNPTSNTIKGDVLDYAPGRSGELYMLVGSQPKGEPETRFTLVRFDADGNINSTKIITGPIRPQQLAAFPSGDFLLAGTDSMTRDDRRKPAVGLFNSQLQWLKPITLQGDITDVEKIGAGSVDPSAFQMGLDLSEAQAADDGNIYLNRNTPTGPIYVVSPSGQVLRKISLNPPPKSELGSVKVGQGRLVAQFLQYQKQDRPGILDVERYCYRVFDLHAGNEIAEYCHGPDIGGTFAFYSSDGFVLVSATPEGNLELLHLQP